MASATPNSVRFFVALLPPQELQDPITAIKHDFRQRFGSQAALQSPPHVTLQPPFEWPSDQVDRLGQHLTTFAYRQTPVPIVLEGYNAFPPRVIYVDVHQTTALMAIQPSLMDYLDVACGIRDRVSPTRPFTPHVTVGFRDLRPACFHQAWAEYKERPFAAEFVAQTLTLLRHDGQQWHRFADFELNQPGA